MSAKIKWGLLATGAIAGALGVNLPPKEMKDLNLEA